MQQAYAWACCTSLPAFGVVLVQIAVWGRSVFTMEGPAFDPITEAALLLGLIGVAFALFVWSMVTFFRALSEVQGFSVWKALGSAAVPFLALGALAVVGGLLVG